jgi:hypothetical protein
MWIPTTSDNAIIEENEVFQMYKEVYGHFEIDKKQWEKINEYDVSFHFEIHKRLAESIVLYNIFIDEPKNQKIVQAKTRLYFPFVGHVFANSKVRAIYVPHCSGA